MQMGKSMKFFELLFKVPEAYGDQLWMGLKDCRKHEGGPRAVVELYQEIVKKLPPSSPHYLDVYLLMLNAMAEVGDNEQAQEALQLLKGLIIQEKVSIH